MKNKLSLLITLLLLSLCMSSCGPFPDESAVLRIMTEEYFPYNYQDNGTWKGSTYDIVSEILIRTNRNEEIEIVDWTSGLNALKNEKNTVLFTTALTAERQQEFKWVGPVGQISWALFTRTNENGVGQLEALDGARNYRIAVVADYPPHQLLTSNGFQNLVVETTSDAALDKFFNQEVDLVATDDNTLILYIQKYINSEFTGAEGSLKEIGVEDAFTLETNLLYIAFSKDVSDDVITQWQNALDRMKEEGVFDNIYRSYIPRGPSIEKLQIYTEPYPPISFINEENIITGGATEVVRAIMDKLNVPDNIVLTIWNNAYNLTLINPNVVLFSIERITEREDLFNWVGPIGRNSAHFYTKAGSGVSAASIEEAASLGTIGTCSSWFTEQMLVSMGFSNLNSYSTPTELVAALMSNQIDATVFTDITVSDIVEEAGFTMLDIEKQGPLTTSDFYMALSKGTEPEIVSEWQKALAEMKSDGSFEEIYKRWYPLAEIP